MKYQIAVFDDDLWELHNTEHIRTDHQREHLEHSFSKSKINGVKEKPDEQCKEYGK